MSVRCCRDCKDRHTACHDTCKKYKDEVKAHKDATRSLTKDIEIDWFLCKNKPFR